MVIYTTDVEFYSITMMSEWPRGLPLLFAVHTVYTMEPNESEESDEMYSLDGQGEYAPKVGVPSFSVQGLSDALTALETVTGAAPIRGVCPITQGNDGQLPRVSMPTCIFVEHGMVLHVLKSDPTL